MRQKREFATEFDVNELSGRDPAAIKPFQRLDLLGLQSGEPSMQSGDVEALPRTIDAAAFSINIPFGVKKRAKPRV